MTGKDQRDVWLMQAPYSDYSSAKVRPVIVVSNNSYNRNSQDFLAVHITTRIDHPYAMMLSGSDFVSGGISDESVVRFDTITRYEEKLLMRKIGKVKPEFYKKLYEKITALISSPP